MNLTFVPKEPGKAYVADRLWLPKKAHDRDPIGVRPEPVKQALEFMVSGGPREGQIKMSMWEESAHHVICPREFLPSSHYPNYKFPFIDLRPEFQKASFRDLVVPRDAEQQAAWQALALNDNGILNLGCGKGKTKLALKKIAQKGTPTLVIVPDSGILSQWRESIFGNPSKGILPGLEFDGELGIIQGPQFKWDCPVTLAQVTTLWMRIESGAIPEEVFRHFGLVIYDEVHTIGAPKFSLTATPFYGDRIGLTATVRREDGLDPIYRYHLGEPFYSDLKQDLVPRIYFQKTPTLVDHKAARNASNFTNISVLRTMIGRDYAGNVFRYWNIKAALDDGRKILCLSHSKDQLKLFHALFPGSSLIVGETDKDERMDILRSSQICFAIAKLGSQGVDDDALDTLFWLTPFRSRISLQQSMGRIQRRREGKRTPVMIVFEDFRVPPLKKLCMVLKSNLREWNFNYEVLNPLEVPADFPADLKTLYNSTFAELPDRGDSIEED